VVLDQPQNIVNIAGCIRAMMNFGLGRLRLVRPAEFDEYRITGIAHRSDPVVQATELFDTLDDAVADVNRVLGTTARPRTATRNYVRPREIAPELLQATAHGTVAVLFGREDRGLDNDALDLCDHVGIVPTDPNYSSLNLAQACLLVCYEIFLAPTDQNPRPRGKRDMGPATREELERMYEALGRGLESIRFYKGARRPESIIRTLRTLLSRAEPDLREARLVQAIGFEIEKYVGRLEESAGVSDEAYDETGPGAPREEPRPE